MYDGEVDVLELDLLLDRGRVLVVHRGEQRHHLHLRFVLALAAGEARIDAVAIGSRAGPRARFEALPVRERAQAGVGRDEIHEVRGARAGQADHDDRRRELDVEDLRAPAHEILDEQPAVSSRIVRS